ncbi:hypothetical protein EG346_02155 [Chryseobacterium carnipullorum]|uniref:DNA-directed RNA polymerase subunit alpha n=1 Tax=Chryseobacterium carnipullorum TaxID=1124835 RepID=A0A376EET4_CHRCU|nr:DNA-directed RNA polymerase subunit alpha C-terminal domain-containing protein [Chryseobacterium carnipullorum]AZA47072.1 hypothetical protein EG346_02155 [Chryseobacterium carnipullorum]AZA66421.1 hypothetical protein EG345_18265 [Chryseobacterium carnipullorum]STD07682.1 DNA-directed RNA polymerase subunit alpha [Chryseobacterium carnipullorum]
MNTIEIYFNSGKITVKSNCRSKYELMQILNKTILEFENYAIKNRPNAKYEFEYSLKLNENILKKTIFNTAIKSHLRNSRIGSALTEYEIETILQLVKLKKERLKFIRGLGPKAINEIDDCVKKLGLKFDMSDEEIFVYCEKNSKK